MDRRVNEMRGKEILANNRAARESGKLKWLNGASYMR